jgi:hypothetical protein
MTSVRLVGSQSLRKVELDERREVGVFVKGATIVNELIATFEAEWAHTRLGARVGSATPQSR